MQRTLIKNAKIVNEGIVFEGDILIEGDNYHALSVLNYTHENSVDLIFIDPPYNIGGDFIYNDKIVDPDDSYRHLNI